MRAILGIGNVGSRYAETRHNIGFMFLDYLAGKYSLSFIPSKGDYYFCKGKIKGSDFTLIRPSTYVNNSGSAAYHFISENNLTPEDLLVIHDDINLDFGKIKTKLNGGDGGHNGISSIIYHLQTNLFPRVRLGIGNNFSKGAQVNYVLDKFPPDEIAQLENVFEKVFILAEEFIFSGTKGLLDVNSRLNPKEKKKDDNQIDEN